MKLKQLLRFPEILLPLSLLAGLPVVIHKTIDIQLHDTYFVFGGVGWGYSNRWRWVHVSVVVICWLTILTMLVAPSRNWISLEGLYYYSQYGSVYSAAGIIARLAALIIFILGQLIFWIVATIRLISDRGARASE